jgi:hypothetical protein
MKTSQQKQKYLLRFCLCIFAISSHPYIVFCFSPLTLLVTLHGQYRPKPGSEVGLVITHPHPLMGGSMANNVTRALSIGLSEHFSTLCFNTRGKSSISLAKNMKSPPDTSDDLASRPKYNMSYISLSPCYIHIVNMNMYFLPTAISLSLFLSLFLSLSLTHTHTHTRFVLSPSSHYYAQV